MTKVSIGGFPLIGGKESCLKKSKDCSKNLLQSCKSWGSPCTKSEELQYVLVAKLDSQGNIVKTELTFYCNTRFNNISQIYLN